MSTHTDSFRNYVTSNFNNTQGNNYDLILPIWFTETHWHIPSASSKASPAFETDSNHRGQNTIYFELDYPGSSEITSCRMVVWCDNAVRVLQQSDGEGTGYSQGNGRLLLANAGMVNTETGNFTLKTGKNRFIFEVANHGNIHGGAGYLLACAVTSDATNNNLIFHTGHHFCRWGGYTNASTTYDSLGQGWKWKNGFFSNTDAPVLSGVPSNTTITDEDSYTIPTVTATDTTDGSLTVTVSNGGFTTSGSSSHTTGNYTITFTATDSNSITTTSSYVLTVEPSAFNFPVGMWIYQNITCKSWLHTSDYLIQTISLHDATYDPNNSSIRETNTGEIASTTKFTNNTVGYRGTYGHSRKISTSETNVVYIRVRWEVYNTSTLSNRSVSMSTAGGLTSIEWGSTVNSVITKYIVYYLTTSGRTTTHGAVTAWKYFY